MAEKSTKKEAKKDPQNLDDGMVLIHEDEKAALIHNQMFDFIGTVSEMENLNLDSRQIQKLTIYIMGSWFKGKQEKPWKEINLKRSGRWIMDYFDRVKVQERLAIQEAKEGLLDTLDDSLAAVKAIISYDMD